MSELVDQAVTYVTTPTTVGVSGMIVLGQTVESWVLIGTAILLAINILTKMWSGATTVRKKIRKLNAANSKPLWRD